ncbi:MAG: hypothetical protein NC900_03100 [Candidatus Omnitrophica bacterium]|nr:hypothetical protein [Candidatus Omnitrophota bacterium]
MMRRIILFCLLIWIIFSLKPTFLSADENSGAKRHLPELLFFYSETCHACHKVRQEVMPAIEKEFFDKIKIVYLDIANIDNYKLMLGLKEKYNCKETGVPTVFIGGSILVGYSRIKERLRNSIIESLQKREITPISELSEVDLIKRFRSFGILAIISAGLIDGINPCAFTVIVFFISFLAVQGYRRREILTIGLSFILAVFLTYVLIGLGIFRFLYALRGFYWITKVVYYLIALFCFILGILSLYDLWLFKKNKSTEGITLQLPQIIKNRIHTIIGLYYRKRPYQKQTEPKANLLKLIISAFLVGFIVSLLEAVCTGQLYLPTITFMLKEQSMRLIALWYLLLYNLMFIVPLILVLLFALLGTTSEGFSYFVKKHIVIIKLLMAILFFTFGIIIGTDTN